MLRLFLLISIAMAVSLEGSLTRHVTLNLNKPTYEGSTISTHHGGVISCTGLRIQARHIIYQYNKDPTHPVQKVIAEGDLMVKNGEYTYVGQRFEYDFITQTGIIHQGVTHIDLWFMGGEKIQLHTDQSAYIYNAFITTSEDKNIDWKLQAKQAHITPEGAIKADNISMRIFEVPIFWFPTIRSHLKHFMDSPIRYRINWDQGKFPQIAMRYHLYSWEGLDLFARLNLRPSKGLGGAIESKYHTERTQFHTHNYLDHDTFYEDLDPSRPRTHYRMQGLYHACNAAGNTQFTASYDWLSDKTLQNGYHSDLFERANLKQTQLSIHHFEEWMIAGLSGRFRINPFQGMKQELPEVFWAPKPFQLGRSGIISQNRFKVAYLDYVSAHDIAPLIPHFSASRLAMNHTLYRPFSYKGLHIAPLVGATGIYYGNSQKSHAVLQGTFQYQLLTHLKLQRDYASNRHIVKPYLCYQGISKPKLATDTPYIFSIQDGFHKINLLKPGVKHLFYFKNSTLFEPNITADIYAYHFFGPSPFTRMVPKIQGDFQWNFPSLTLSSHIGWNIENNVLDYTNIRLAYTVNEHVAFKTELRHRGCFNWRKDDPNNFIMDVSRSVVDLFHSPLSDKRNTLLSKLQIQIIPNWVARFESQIGWGRINEPFYNQFKIDLSTIISNGWKLRLTYAHSPAPENRNSHFSLSLSLVRN